MTNKDEQYEYKKISLITITALIILLTGTCSSSDPAEKEADRLEDRADQIRKEDKENRKATEKAGEAIADQKEDDADRVRKAAEDKAARMEDDADRIRKGTKE